MKRLVFTEDADYALTITKLAHELGMDRYDLMSSLYAADNYLSKRLGIGSALRINRDKFRFGRVAGIFPVTDQLEIEVIPKFMTGNETWRADFLLLLARTRWGVLAERQMVATSKSRERSINDSLALVFLTMFESVAHVPIRTYCRRRIQEFQVEGDLEEESVLLPDRDGFEQEITEFTRKNVHNAVISEAARVLVKSVGDFDLRSRLERAVQQLGPQRKLPSSLPHEVPSRFRGWAELYGLSVDILDGYGIDYVNQGDIMSPGFVVRTSDAWEEFLRQALVSGLSDCRVAFQEKHPFAKRDNSTVRVRPDYVVRSKCRALLVDAKYKYDDAKSNSISNSDIYEGWAFMKATGIPRLLLLYPYVTESDNMPFEVFQHVMDDVREIIGVRVNPMLENPNGMNVFARKLAAFVKPHMVNNIIC